MKIAMFKTKEEYAEWIERQIAMYRKAREERAKIYAEAQNGVGRKGFIEANLGTTKSDEDWEHHLEWLRDYVKYYDRKIKKLQKDLAKIA